MGSDMQNLKRGIILFFGLLLRLVLIVWIFAIAAVFFKFNDRLLFSLVFLIFWTLQFTKWDIKFISNNINKWQFRMLLFSAYTAAWGIALFKHYIIGGFESGFVFLFDRLAIAPLSEGMLSIFVYFPLGQIESLGLAGKKIVNVYLDYLSTPVSVIASFVVLELLLRLLKRIFVRTGKVKPQQIRPWIYAQFIVFIATAWVMLTSVYDFSFSPKEDKLNVQNAFEIVKTAPRIDGKFIGKFGENVSRVFCAFTFLRSQSNSKELFENLNKESLADGGKIYLLIWLFEHNREEYTKAKLMINRQSPFEVIAGDLLIKLPQNEVLEKIENGELKLWLNMQMNQFDSDGCKF